MEANRKTLALDDEIQIGPDRESEAALSDAAASFAKCAKSFGARIGSNGWASSGDVPAGALAACLDPIMVALAGRRVSIHRIVNQVHDAIERTQPPPSFPFMPFELFDASGPVRAAIADRIRQVVRDGGANTKQPRGRPPISEAKKTRALQIRAAGGSNRKAAMELYDTKTPSRQQVSNASTILREFTKKTSRLV